MKEKKMCKIYVGETLIKRSMYAKNDQEITKIICIFFRKVKHELKILNFRIYKKFYFQCLANAELKPHTKVLKNLFHKMALKNLYVTTILSSYFSSWET